MYSRRQFLNRFIVSTGGAFVMMKADALARVTEAVGNLNHAFNANAVASDEEFWAHIQSAFDVDRTLINLNNGGVSPSPTVVMNAMKRYLDYSTA